MDTGVAWLKHLRTGPSLLFEEKRATEQAGSESPFKLPQRKSKPLDACEPTQERFQFPSKERAQPVLNFAECKPSTDSVVSLSDVPQQRVESPPAAETFKRNEHLDAEPAAFKLPPPRPKQTWPEEQSVAAKLRPSLLRDLEPAPLMCPTEKAAIDIAQDQPRRTEKGSKRAVKKIRPVEQRSAHEGEERAEVKTEEPLPKTARLQSERITKVAEAPLTDQAHLSDTQRESGKARSEYAAQESKAKLAAKPAQFRVPNLGVKLASPRFPTFSLAKKAPSTPVTPNQCSSAASPTMRASAEYPVITPKATTKHREAGVPPQRNTEPATKVQKLPAKSFSSKPDVNAVLKEYESRKGEQRREMVHMDDLILENNSLLQQYCNERLEELEGVFLNKRQDFAKQLEDMNEMLSESSDKLKEQAVRLYMLNNECLFMDSPILRDQIKLFQEQIAQL